VRLTIAAHLELYHLTALFKLRQNIFIKFPETQNHPGLICTTNYVKTTFNTRVTFLKIAMECTKKRKFATATSQSSQHFVKPCGINCSYHHTVFIIRIRDFMFAKLNKFFIP